eukprot:2319761-Pleurochrysis_carterae.AAC.2
MKLPKSACTVTSTRTRSVSATLPTMRRCAHAQKRRSSSVPKTPPMLEHCESVGDEDGEANDKEDAIVACFGRQQGGSARRSAPFASGPAIARERRFATSAPMNRSPAAASWSLSVSRTATSRAATVAAAASSSSSADSAQESHTPQCACNSSTRRRTLSASSALQLNPMALGLCTARTFASPLKKRRPAGGALAAIVPLHVVWVQSQVDSRQVIGHERGVSVSHAHVDGEVRRRHARREPDVKACALRAALLGRIGVTHRPRRSWRGKAPESACERPRLPRLAVGRVVRGLQPQRPLDQANLLVQAGREQLPRVGVGARVATSQLDRPAPRARFDRPQHTARMQLSLIHISEPTRRTPI